jgi:hypothetical protein
MLLVDDMLVFPARGILWVFREIHKAACEEVAAEADTITERLKSLYAQLEAGRISSQEFDAQEKVLLDRLDAIEGQGEGAEVADE